jgi:hypothetical protein
MSIRRISGANGQRIMVRHILPGMMSVMMVSMMLKPAMMIEALISFAGSEVELEDDDLFHSIYLLPSLWPPMGHLPSLSRYTALCAFVC